MCDFRFYAKTIFSGSIFLKLRIAVSFRYATHILTRRNLKFVIIIRRMRTITRWYLRSVFHVFLETTSRYPTTTWFESVNGTTHPVSFVFERFSDTASHPVYASFRYRFISRVGGDATPSKWLTTGWNHFVLSSLDLPSTFPYSPLLSSSLRLQRQRERDSTEGVWKRLHENDLNTAQSVELLLLWFCTRAIKNG